MPNAATCTIRPFPFTFISVPRDHTQQVHVFGTTSCYVFCCMYENIGPSADIDMDDVPTVFVPVVACAFPAAAAFQGYDPYS